MSDRLPRTFAEPGFTRACVRLATAVADELIYAADQARPEWAELSKAYPAELARIREELTQNPALFRTPLVWNFAVAWAKALRWPVTARFRDGISIELPAEMVRDLRSNGRLDGIEFFLAGLADVCLGRLGSNDHDLSYGLYVNVPIWIPLAVEPQWRDSFNRQIRMVIFHETAHFRWIGDGLRGEQMAHARGVASLRAGAWPADRTAMAALLERDHPEAWHNPEIRSLILETKGGVRLVRAWADRMAAARLTTASRHADRERPLEASSGAFVPPMSEQQSEFRPPKLDLVTNDSSSMGGRSTAETPPTGHFIQPRFDQPATAVRKFDFTTELRSEHSS